MRVAIVSLLLFAVACGSQVAASDEAALEECIAALVAVTQDHTHISISGSGLSYRQYTSAARPPGQAKTANLADILEPCTPFID